MRSKIYICLASLAAIALAISNNGSLPLFKDSSPAVEDRVADLLSRMTIEDKTAQLVQGDLRNWLNTEGGSLNQTGLEWSMNNGIKVGQDYLMLNTTLGIPAWVQSEGIHGFLIPNATIFNSPIAHACSFNPSLVEKMAKAIAQEARALGVNQIFGPLADLARELRFGRVEETFGEDGYLTIIDTGTPTVVIFSSGKPITEPWISDAASALLLQFYPSEQGGHALADVLFGDVNPSGKLSVSFPYDIGTTPIYYDYLNSARAYPDPGSVSADGSMTFGHNYVLQSPLPLYEFGYGKSYSTFTYSHMALSQTTVSRTDTVTVSIDITNNSTRDGAEVVQVYVQDLAASVVVPNKQLRGFSKVFIPSGATKTVKIDIVVSDLGLWDLSMTYVVEPGEFAVHIGSSSKDTRANATFTVV
ncbi:hypothetical protein Daesc_001777 [Daldinia eschscholtzii]|uniref:beta-glucosidase n=1 Tax=Daldinia eschscholtzii TaxID=292717 RepID=A0AAX6MV47_9PEZI